jgi:hypothetical protein
VYDFRAIVAALMGVTLLLSGFCIVCGISPFVGVVWTGTHASLRAGAPAGDRTPGIG